VSQLLFRRQRITETLIKDVIKVMGMGRNRLEEESPGREGVVCFSLQNARGLAASGVSRAVHEQPSPSGVAEAACKKQANLFFLFGVHLEVLKGLWMWIL